MWDGVIHVESEAVDVTRGLFVETCELPASICHPRYNNASYVARHLDQRIMHMRWEAISDHVEPAPVERLDHLSAARSASDKTQGMMGKVAVH